MGAIVPNTVSPLCTGADNCDPQSAYIREVHMSDVKPFDNHQGTISETDRISIQNSGRTLPAKQCIHNADDVYVSCCSTSSDMLYMWCR